MTDAEILEKMVAKARGKLAAAKRAVDARDWDDASSRAYYAAFHAVAAVLRQRGLSCSSHGETLGAFNRECVRTGEVPGELTKVLTRLFQDRQLGDYEFVHTIDEMTANADVQDAARVLTVCCALLERRTGLRFATT